MSEANKTGAIRTIANVRNRLRDMLNGDNSVDIPTLMCMLNDSLEVLGMPRLKLSSEEMRSRFYVEDESV